MEPEGDRDIGAEATDTCRKVAFLGDPANHADRPAAVEVVETHMSWVFLTDRHVYKFKKPVNTAHVRLATLAARHGNCEEEVRLNARLAPDVYIGVVPLVLSAVGRLAIDGDGTPVEWLVKMHRLPRSEMLDDALARDAVSPDDIRRAMEVLVAFYRQLPPALSDPGVYFERLRHSVEEHAAALDGAGFPHDAGGTDVPRVLVGFLDRESDLLAARATDGYVVEGHGDLRPEHVCLARHPVFIDCLEFNRELRILDVADELAYLALECECLEAPFVGDIAFRVYGEATGDIPRSRVVAFYKARRGLLRARLCLSHLADDHDEHARATWIPRARMYLDMAARYCRAL